MFFSILKKAIYVTEIPHHVTNALYAPQLSPEPRNL